MGSYCSLYIQELELMWNKNDVIGTEFFLPSDKKKFPSLEDDDYLICQYSAPVNVIIDRLKAMGANIDDAILGQKAYIEELKVSYLSLHDEPDRQPDPKTLKLIEDFSFKKWQSTIRRLLTTEKSDYYYDRILGPSYDLKNDVDVIYNDHVDHSYLGINSFYLHVVLAVLELVEDKENTNVILDYSDLVAGGYFSSDEDICTQSNTGKTVILTEGVTDKRFIQRSLKVLCPHIYDYYSFLDFNELRLSGSASSLVHTIKAFSAAGILNSIIAVFDNDTAGRVARKGLNGLPIGKNIRVLSLPVIDFLNNYPTIGPQGTHYMNVNGLAGSIELYFEESVLRDIDGSFIPVIWKGYEESIRSYQGEVLRKNEIQKRYEALLDRIENGESFSKYNFNSMLQVLNAICGFKINGGWIK